jgi:hypothetical protein
MKQPVGRKGKEEEELLPSFLPDGWLFQDNSLYSWWLVVSNMLEEK